MLFTSAIHYLTLLLDVCLLECNWYSTEMKLFHVCYGIRKYGSTSYVGMGLVQNGVLYLRYRSDFVIMKAER